MRFAYLALSILLSGLPLRAGDTADQRLKDSTDVFKEIMAAPDKGIPQDLLEEAHCLVIVPGVKQAAFLVGGKFGKSFAFCVT
jgi:lipid-binding SYLF domain-containing protein